MNTLPLIPALLLVASLLALLASLTVLRGARNALRLQQQSEQRLRLLARTVVDNSANSEPPAKTN